MATKFNGAAPSELFAEAIKRTMEEAINPMLDMMADLEKRQSAELNSVRTDLHQHITSSVEELQSHIGGISKKVDAMQRDHA